MENPFNEEGKKPRVPASKSSLYWVRLQTSGIYNFSYLKTTAYRRYNRDGNPYQAKIASPTRTDHVCIACCWFPDLEGSATQLVRQERVLLLRELATCTQTSQVMDCNTRSTPLNLDHSLTDRTLKSNRTDGSNLSEHTQL